MRLLFWTTIASLLGFAAAIAAVYEVIDRGLDAAFQKPVARPDEKIGFEPGMDLQYELYRLNKELWFQGETL